MIWTSGLENKHDIYGRIEQNSEPLIQRGSKHVLCVKSEAVLSEEYKLVKTLFYESSTNILEILLALSVGWDSNLVVSLQEERGHLEEQKILY